MKIKVTTSVAPKTIECDKIDVDGDGNLCCTTKSKIVALFAKGFWFNAQEILEPVVGAK